MSSDDKAGWKQPNSGFGDYTNQTRIDRSIDSSHAYTYEFQNGLGERSTPVSDPASIDAFSELIDRDKRINTALLMETGLIQNSLAEQRNTPISNKNYSDGDATTFFINGPGIEIYGLKSSQLGLADVKSMVICWRTKLPQQEQLKRCINGTLQIFSSGFYL